ncbi:lipase [Aureimonas sp. Leaf454]|nr:lipase [Aureimonas sp. Leaf454]
MTAAFRRRIPVVVALLAALSVLAGCSAAGILNAVTSSAGYRIERDVRYGEGDRGTLDLYVPAGAGATSPVVVFFYGGSWDSGSKDLYLFVGQALASRGFIVAVPDYRVYPEVRFPAFVEDGATAVRFVDEAAREGRNGLPAGRHPLFLMGHSAGAEIAGLLATDERYLARQGLAAGRLAGFVGLAGPYDFLPLTEERYKRVFPEATRAASQPVRFVDGREPPMLLVAGDADTTVDPENTRSLARTVERAGGTARAMIVRGVDHIGAVSALSTALPFNDPAIRDAVVAFIEEHS